MGNQTICGGDYLRMVRAGASRLGAGRKQINDLNVFPIPDGDTGDNMYMTIRSGCEAAASLGPDCSLEQVAAEVSRGMLLGARGNSGVILSRIFAGISKGLQGPDADPAIWHEAMLSGVGESYKAVAQPVEGTILTVFRESVDAAGRAAQEGFEAYLDLLCDEAAASVERTPEQLDVLRSAGVVDSGGAGLQLILEGMRAALRGEAVEDDDAAPAAQAAKVDLDAFTEDSVLEFGYCTEFLLRLQTAKIGALAEFDESVIREYLEGAGDSLVFFRDGSIIKVHVHTRTPGDVLNRCQSWGEFLTIKVENMTLQHHENRMDEKFPKAPKAPRRNVAVIAVASGEGLCGTFRDMGALVVEGGQTMNPSADAFLKAFEEANARTIYVLPNNSNIVMTAQQAAGLYKDSDVHVLPTVTIGGGYSVLGSIDFAESGPEEVEAQAAEIIAGVVTGMVSKASRTTEKTREGDYIGFSKHDIFSDSPDRYEAAVKLCEGLEAGSYDVLVIFKGAGAPADEAERLAEELQRWYPRTEIALSDGGQPIFDYIFVLE